MVRVVVRLRLVCALFVLPVLTTCGVPDPATPGTGVSGASQPNPAEGAEPAVRCLAAVRTARYGDYAGKPDSKVASEQAFEAMRRYVLDRYGTAPVSRSYLLGDATFDCVGTPSQPAADAHCPSGTVPVRRVTLTELARFPTLQGFLSKDPGGGGLPPVPQPTR